MKSTAPAGCDRKRIGRKLEPFYMLWTDNIKKRPPQKQKQKTNKQKEKTRNHNNVHYDVFILSRKYLVCIDAGAGCCWEADIQFVENALWEFF